MPTIREGKLTPDYAKIIDIDSLISTPLVASSKANVVMVTGQTRFLLEYCFKLNKNTGNYEPNMIDMVMTRGIIENDDEKRGIKSIRKIELTFSVPLLCLITLNTLAINKVSLEFEMDITSSTNVENTEEFDKKTGTPITKKKVHLFGNLSNSSNYDQDSNNPKSSSKSSMSSRLKVNIDAGTLPLPKGVLTLIDLFTKGIQPVPMSEVKK
jgi:hypothetical protein